MNEVNWNDVFALTQILVVAGAFAHLPFCGILLALEMAIMCFIVFPIGVLFGINAIFGGEVTLIVILLAIAIGIYYFIASKEMK